MDPVVAVAVVLGGLAAWSEVQRTIDARRHDRDRTTWDDQFARLEHDARVERRELLNRIQHPNLIPFPEEAGKLQQTEEETTEMASVGTISWENAWGKEDLTDA